MPDLLEIALRAARAGGRDALKHFRRKSLRARIKPDGSPVSEADKASDAAILQILRRAFPTHGILSEESGLSPGDGRHLWIADPLDGTAPFLRNIPSWTTLLALEIHGRLEVAVAFAPALGITL